MIFIQTKRQIRFFLFAIFTCTFLATSLSWAGPWSRPPGHFYAKISEGIVFSTDTINPDNPGTPYMGTTTSFYGEIGLLYGVVFQAFLPFTIATHTSRTNPNEFFQLGGFGDSNLGLKWTPPPLQKLLGFPIAARINVKIPMYDTQMLNKVKGLKSSTSFPFLGTGQIDLTFWLVAGGSIPNTALYLFGEVGYTHRTTSYIGEGFSASNTAFLDSFVFHFQAGYNFFKKVLVMLNVQGAFSLGTELAPLTKSFVGLGLGVYIPVYKGLAVEASFNPLVFAVNSDRSVGFSLGLSYNY